MYAIEVETPSVEIDCSHFYLYWDVKVEIYWGIFIIASWKDLDKLPVVSEEVALDFAR